MGLPVPSLRCGLGAPSRPITHGMAIQSRDLPAAFCWREPLVTLLGWGNWNVACQGQATRGKGTAQQDMGGVRRPGPGEGSRAAAFPLINGMWQNNSAGKPSLAPPVLPHKNSQYVPASTNKPPLRRAVKITAEPRCKALSPNSHCAGLRIASGGKIASQQSPYNGAYITATWFYIGTGLDFSMARARSGNGMHSTQY